MMDLLFFIKTVAITLLLIVALQIKVGPSSIENHAVTFFQGSTISQPLTEVAQGGAKIIREMVLSLHEKIYSKFHGSSQQKDPK